MRTLRASRSQGTRPRPIHASAGATVACSSPARGGRHELPLPPDAPRHEGERRTSLDPDEVEPPTRGGQLDPIDPLRGLSHEPGGLELDEPLALGPSAGERHGRDEAHGEQRHDDRGATARPRHRRRHHTTAPTTTTLSGSKTSRVVKIRCIWRVVRRTIGGTGTLALTFGMRSSRTSHRTIESARSLFAMYGK